MTGRRRGNALLPGLLVAAAVLSACDALLTEPRPASDVEISFQIEQLPLGGTTTAFSRVRRVFLRFARPDASFRDTVVAVLPVDGRVRAGVALQTGERVEALGIFAELGYGTTALFAGQTVVPIVPGTPTRAEIPILPIPAEVRPDRPLLTLTGPGAAAQLTSAVLFASGDTITGPTGVWSSLDPTIVAVTPGGLAVAQRLGQTQLEVRFDTLSATVLAEVVQPR